MHKRINILASCVSVLVSCSCARAIDKTLSPPSDTQWVNVEVQNPSPYTKPFPLEVVYISHKCTKSSINGVDGSREAKPSYNGIKVPLLQQGNTNDWHAKVAVKGGGSCEWTLSEFNLGIEYIDATHLGKDLVPGTAVGATIAFDDIAARNGKFDDFSGNISFSPLYFPVIQEEINPKKRTLNLFGKKDFLSLKNLKILDNIIVHYEPILNEKKIIRMVAPKENKHGVFYSFVYPDGSVISDGSINPNFEKINDFEIK